MDFVLARLLGNNWQSGILGKLIAKGWRRGVQEGSRVWLVLGGAALLFGLSKRDKMPKVVFSQELKPGETLLLTAQPADAVLVDR